MSSSDFSKALRDFSKRVERAVEGGHVGLPELFPPAFMQRHTSFGTLQEMVDASPWKEADNEALAEALKSEAWSDYVRENTSFQSWTAMLSEAVAERARRKFAES